MAQAHSVMHTSIRACFLCFFYNPYMSFFNSKNFSFTCLHFFLTCFHVYYTIVSRQLETELTHDPWANVHACCVLLATVLTAVATVSRTQFSHVILPVGSGSCTRFELSLTELRNVRDTYSVAPLFPKLRVEVSRSQAFSGSWAWLRKARS